MSTNIYLIHEFLAKCFYPNGKTIEDKVTAFKSEISTISDDLLPAGTKQAIKTQLDSSVAQIGTTPTKSDFAPVENLAKKFNGKFKGDVYHALLAYTKIAHIFEKSSVSPQENALKLALIFNDYSKALEYIKGSAERKVTIKTAQRNETHFAKDTDEKLVQEACSFKLPNSADIDWKTWRKHIDAKTLLQSPIRALLEHAHNLEKMINDSPKPSPDELAKNKEQRERLSEKLRDLKHAQETKHEQLAELTKLSIDKLKPLSNNKLKKLLEAQTPELPEGTLSEAIELKSNLDKIKQDIDSITKKLSPGPIYSKITMERVEKIEQQKKTIKELANELAKLDRNIKKEPADQERYDYLKTKVSEEKIKLTTLVSGRTFANIQADELLAFFEVIKAKDTDYMFFINAGNKKGMTSEKYNQFLALDRSQAGTNIPNLHIDGNDISHPRYYMRKLNVKDDKHEAVVAACLGKLFRYCCQSLSGESGEPCVIHGLTDPNGGFYVLCEKKSKDAPEDHSNDKIIAQSWVWRGTNGELVFDSIEGNHDNVPLVKDFYDHAASQLVGTKLHDDDKEIDTVSVGINVAGKTPRGIGMDFNVNAFPVRYNSYRDSKQQRILESKHIPYLKLISIPSDELAKTKSTEMLNHILTNCDNLTSNKFIQYLIYHMFDYTSLKSEQSMEERIIELKAKYFDLSKIEKAKLLKLDDVIQLNLDLYNEISKDDDDINQETILQLLERGASLSIKNNKGDGVFSAMLNDFDFFQENTLPKFTQEQLTTLIKSANNNSETELHKLAKLPFSAEDLMADIIKVIDDKLLKEDSVDMLLMKDSNNDTFLQLMTNTPGLLISSLKLIPSKILLKTILDKNKHSNSILSKVTGNPNLLIDIISLLPEHERLTALCDKINSKGTVLDNISEETIEAVLKTLPPKALTLLDTAEKPSAIKAIAKKVIEERCAAPVSRPVLFTKDKAKEPFDSSRTDENAAVQRTDSRATAKAATSS